MLWGQDPNCRKSQDVKLEAHSKDFRFKKSQSALLEMGYKVFHLLFIKIFLDVFKCVNILPTRVCVHHVHACYLRV